MTNEDDKELRALLKGAFPPATGAELQRDLWPAVLRRVQEKDGATPWFDWALAGGVFVWLALNPKVVLVLFYFL